MVKRCLLILTLSMLNACSVFMAATGSDPVDFSVVQLGADRSDIERTLGKPIIFHRKGGADFAVYQVLTNDLPDYRRAAANALIVGVTLGLGELITFPTEALQGDQNRIEILYTPEGKVISYRHIVNEAPLPNPSEVVDKKLSEIQKQI